MLKRTSNENLLTRSLDTVRKAALGVASLGLAAAVTAGCLQRPVRPADPRTNNVYVDQIRQTAVDKIDLLFMIDNSISMADKQAILSRAVPTLVNRLITPICVDATGVPVGGTVGPDGTCANGEPEFSAIRDIHIGIVSSSLGAHGGNVCAAPMNPGDTPDDHARLMGTIRPNYMPALQSWNNLGFLAWDPDANRNNPPGISDPNALVSQFTDHVVATGELGCGYEASLEAWYRFLIDPEPPAQVVKSGDVTVKDGVDQAVLDQRNAFLRADSLVAVVMLTDENDCSIVDDGQGWLVGYYENGFRMPRATSACANNPNDPCCRSCATGESSPPSGCGDLGSDPECAKGTHDAISDDLNLRCFDQKRRFGFNLLYPVDRYVDGLRNPTVPDRAGNPVPNPLFAPKDGKAGRDPALVFLAGIIGVPWQDVATPESVSGAGLTYLTAQQIREQGVWDVILGDPNSNVFPTDPLMIEQVEPRTGTNPVINAPVGPADSTNPQANPINGHEQVPDDRTDLQYACIFPLDTPRACTDAMDNACDCRADDIAKNRPLCQPPGGGAAGTTQYYAKAYPGVRHLQTLKLFGDNAIVASICPKVLDQGSADYGYNPAVGAIISRLKEALTGKCLPRQLIPEANPDSPDYGKVPCAVIEATFSGGAGCTPCDQIQGREEPDPVIRPAVLENLQITGQCGGATGIDCNSACLCEIVQFQGEELSTCQTSAVPPNNLVGYCYVEGNPDDPADPRNDIVSKCKPTERRILRFVDPNNQTPQKGAVTFIACLGATIGTNGTQQQAAMP